MAASEGVLFVASGSNINKHNLSGNLVTLAWGTSISGNFKGLTAFTVVPEPSTWLQGCIAKGVIGLQACGRKACRD